MKNIIISLFLASTLSVFSQNNDYHRAGCVDYHRTHCKKSSNIYYKFNSSSRSALFYKGQTSRTILDAYNGRDYRIAICADDVFKKPIIFRLINKFTNEALYDNSKDNLSQEFEFTVTENLELWIEIEVQKESDTKLLKTNSLIPRDNTTGCIGVLVEFMVTPRKGF